ncbi:hypothetical protein ACFW6V_04865 [Streptomyces sp. NPDC058734]|uniref:hypothetical protein n=1 Tax=Streptomyces sp. NPDC058734 TaxID=3346615 RepID=UPI00369CA250
MNLIGRTAAAATLLLTAALAGLPPKTPAHGCPVVCDGDALTTAAPTPAELTPPPRIISGGCSACAIPTNSQGWNGDYGDSGQA